MAMNERQLEVQKLSLAEEKKLLKQLKACYEKAAQDCADRIAALGGRTDLEHLQTIIYQTQYQQAIKKQIDSILDMLQAESYTDITTYLQNCYENGYIGAMYDLQGQGIPLIFPINQDEVVYALQNDPKLVKPYYDRLGEDVSFLKKAVKAQVSRGIANGSTWAQVANELAQKMRSPFSTALYNSMRIARTEGHRIQQQSQWDALNKAKDKGCDIVKQWDSTLDGRTRPSHRMLDGQIRELDEDFVIGIKKAKYPGAFGRPEEDIHCRCCMTQRARWALDETELETLKSRAEYFGLDKSESFEDFKKKYLKSQKQSFFKTIEEDTFSGLSTEIVRDINKRFKELDEQWGANISGIIDTLTREQREYDTLFKNYVDETLSLHPRMRRKTAEKRALELLGGRPTQVDCFLGGDFNSETRELTLNSHSIGSFTTFSKDSERRKSKLASNAERMANGQKIRKFGNVGEGAETAFIHEYGHAVDFTYNVAVDKRFIDFYSELSEEEISTKISLYAATSEREFIAECFCQTYLPEPTELAIRCVEIIKEIINDTA